MPPKLWTCPFLRLNGKPKIKNDYMGTIKLFLKMQLEFFQPPPHSRKYGIFIYIPNVRVFWVKEVDIKILSFTSVTDQIVGTEFFFLLKKI